MEQWEIDLKSQLNRQAPDEYKIITEKRMMMELEKAFSSTKNAHKPLFEAKKRIPRKKKKFIKKSKRAMTIYKASNFSLDNFKKELETFFNPNDKK